jgi:hypothetical protein
MHFALGEISEVLKNNNLGSQYKTNSCTIISCILNFKPDTTELKKKMGNIQFQTIWSLSYEKITEITII